MTPGARIQAAVEILEDLAANPRPADKALREWGAAHRFAGSKDRAAIRSHVFAAFRRRGEAAEIMGGDGARSLVLGSTRLGLGWNAAEIAASIGAGKHDAAPVTTEERGRLESAQASTHPQGAINWPVWLREKLEAEQGARAEALMASLIETAPLDLRVNVEASERDKVIEALSSVGFPAKPTPNSPWGVRIARDEDLVGANVRALPMFRTGTIEIQDEGSQLTALLSHAVAGEQILELCAGGGGKTLALAAMLGRKGQIYACDIDWTRLKAGQERIKRAGLHIVQPREIDAWDPKDGGGDPDLESLAGKMDLVFLDVPCTGSGAWRRAPDAKWRLTPDAFKRYIETQGAILRRGARLVKPGGRLVYVTCSVFAEENAEQISRFLDRTKEFALADLAAHWREAGEELPDGVGVIIPGAEGRALQLSPTTTHTDGFFIAMLERT
jgi:16S rRNA (cytosine967-C5)-methyltransferase